MTLGHDLHFEINPKSQAHVFIKGFSVQNQSFDPEKIRIITGKVDVLTRSTNTEIGLLAAQFIELCNILTGDDVEIIDPKKIELPHDQKRAFKGVQEAAAKKMSKKLGLKEKASKKKSK